MKKTFSLRLAWYGLITMVTLLPMIVILPWIAYKTYSTMLESSLLKEELYIEQIRDRVNSETTRIITMLENKSDPMSYTIGSDQDINQLLKLLEAILSRENKIHAVFIMNTKAGLIAGIDKNPGEELNRIFLPPGELHGHKFDPESPRVIIPSHGRNYIGSPRRHEGRLIFDLAVPIGRRESPVGVLIASVYVEELWKETGLKSARPEVASYILDRRGSLLSMPPPGSGYKQGDILTRLHIVRSLIISDEHTHPEPYEGLVGIPVFGIGIQIENLNWLVISEIPEKMITTPIYRFLLVIIVLGLFLVTVFGWLGLSISRRMLNPISSLSLAFERARDGDYSASASTSSVRELNVLAEGFNQMMNDINMRERALKESEGKTKAILATLGEGIISIGVDSIIRFVNQELCNIFGYEEKELVGENLKMLMPEKYRFEHAEGMKRYLGGGKPKILGRRLELEGLRKDGTIFPLELRVEATRLEENGSRIFTAAIRDITERKLAEKSLKESEASLSEAQRLAQLGSWELDLVSNDLSWSDEVYHIFDLDPDEFGASYEAFVNAIHPEDRDFVNQAYTDSVKNKTPYDIIHRLLMKDGSLKYVNEMCETFYDEDGTPIRSIGTVQDVTERKQAEDELVKSERKYRSLFKNMQNGLAYCQMIFDENGKPVDWIYLEINDAFENITKLKRENLVGKKVTEAIPGINELKPSLIEIYGKVASTGEGTNFTLDFFPLGIWLSITAYCPKKGYFVSVLENITDRKKAEDELAKHREHLEELVEERTDELSAVNKELEAFSYSVSHDLRAPLRIIDGFSQVLLEDYERKLDDGGKHLLYRLRANSQNMAQLIDDMINLSRLTRKEMHRQEVDLGELALDITKELQEAESGRRVKFAVADGAVVNGDPTLLRAMMENLLGNAWKFTEKQKDARIEFGLTRQNGSTAYFVRDNGAGFDMDYADKLFGAFQRLHSDSEFSGTGIGLATVQRIIHRHGGKVWAEGEVNKGATFYFTL